VTASTTTPGKSVASAADIHSGVISSQVLGTDLGADDDAALTVEPTR
jgi:hypothetical protein